MTMMRQTLCTGLLFWWLVSVSVSLLAATAAAKEPNNEAHALSQKSQHPYTRRTNETATNTNIVEPVNVDVEVFGLRHSEASTSDRDSSNLEWPWSGNKNDTNSNKTRDDRTCKAHANCSSCAESSWCHWCGHDCHAIGSAYGCVYGASCDHNHDDKNKKNETDPSGCTAHTNCGECAISSHLCHWCSHDNACHSVGSVYGCVTGVDCYSNDRCKRTEPEAITDTVFTQIGPMALLVLVTLSAIFFCCASTCFCVASGVKGAYDDLAGITADRASAPPLLQQQQQQSRIAETPEPVTTAAADADADVDVDAEQVGADSTNTANDSAHMVLSEEGNNATDYVRMADDNGQEGEDAPLLVVQQQRTTTRRPPRHMQRLYNACTACYIVTIAVIAGLLFGAVHYFPTKPAYNICNDNVAWKSVIDSMASMKASADFEILASVNNPNYFGVALDMGKSSQVTSKKQNRTEPATRK
jgi:hypothetical protein